MIETDSALSCSRFITARKQSLRRLCFYRCLSVHRGVPGPEGGLVPRGTWWRPPGRLLLRAVRILLECILVTIKNCTKMVILPTLRISGKLDKKVIRNFREYFMRSLISLLLCRVLHSLVVCSVT